MSTTYKRTITVNQSPRDVLATAERVAAALRAEGRTVVVGEVYDNVTVRYYGMPSVDLTVTTPDEPPVEAPPAAPPSDAPKPMPVAEFGGAKR